MLLESVARRRISFGITDCQTIWPRDFDSPVFYFEVVGQASSAPRLTPVRMQTRTSWPDDLVIAQTVTDGENDGESASYLPVPADNARSKKLSRPDATR